MTIAFQAAFSFKSAEGEEMPGEISFPRGEASESTQALSHRKRFKYL